jgi:PEGA domain
VKRVALAWLCLGAAAQAAERVPVAVVWLGDASTLAEGARIVGEVDVSIGRATQTARPLDSAADRRALVDGGPATLVDEHIARADAAFAKLKFADAAKAYAQAEQLLLEETSIAVTQRKLGAVERGLLVCFDQLNMPEDAARAAERLGWTAGTNEDVAKLLDKYGRDHRWEPAMPPVQVTAVPEGAQVYRNLQPIGAAPATVAGGEPSVDAVDVELAGYRRAHAALGSALNGVSTIELKLVKEDRIAVLVDELRAAVPNASAAKVASLGQRLGAARVLVLAPEGPARVRARWLEVTKAAWGGEPIEVDSAGQPAMDKIAVYASPAGATPAAGAVVVTKQAPGKEEKPKSAWGKWYTWVAAGGVVILIGTLLIVDKVGSDKLTVKASH